MTQKSRGKGIAWISVAAGLVLLGSTVIYWTHVAGALPHFFPGFEAGSIKIHFKHGLGSLILAMCLFIFAWFKGAPSV